MSNKFSGKNIARDCAYIAVFSALLIASQLVLSVLPGIELVTVLLIAFSFVFGARRGVLTAVVFTLLRQFIFGFFLNVLLVYLLYFPMLALIFGLLGKVVKPTAFNVIWLTVVACVCTAGFTLLDNVLTPLLYGYSERAFVAYFYASTSFLLPQICCTAITVALLFIPLTKVLSWAKK